MWNGTLRSRTHPVELPYPCTWKNTPVATRGLPEGQAIGISWGATKHSLLHQEHQHSHLNLIQGTSERRRRRYLSSVYQITGKGPTHCSRYAPHYSWRGLQYIQKSKSLSVIKVSKEMLDQGLSSYSSVPLTSSAPLRLGKCRVSWVWHHWLCLCLCLCEMTWFSLLSAPSMLRARQPPTHLV